MRSSRTHGTDRRASRSRMGALILLLPVITLSGSDWLAAQKIAPGGPGRAGAAEKAGEEVDDFGGRFRTDRTSNQRLGKAQELMEDERWAESIGFLESILEQDEDFWFQPERSNKAIHRSVKHVALELIGKLPKSARETYELHAGADAQRMLDEAIAAGDRKKLEEVHRRFFHTKAGYEATHRLALHDLDHAHPLPAALLFERLREIPSVANELEPMLSIKLAVSLDRAGLTNRAVATLLDLKKRNPHTKVNIAGKELELFTGEGQALTWLRSAIGDQEQQVQPGAEEVALYRGNAARNSFSVGGAPLLNARWRIPTSNEKYDVERIVKQQLQSLVDFNITALPSLHPLAIRLNLHESSVLRPGQVRDWPNLIKLLSEADAGVPAAAGPLSQMVTLLSADTRAEIRQVAMFLPGLKVKLDALNEGQPIDAAATLQNTRFEALKVRFIDEMNGAFARRDFFNDQAWALANRPQQDGLRTEAAEWLKRGVAALAEDEVFRLNRCLFEAALKNDNSFHELVSRSYSDVVLMRTYNNLLAVDFATGKRVWEIPKPDDEDTLDRLVKPGANSKRNPAEVGMGLRQRLWEDATFGTLASDGRNVYSVEDLDIRSPAQMQGVRVIAFNGGVQDPSTSNDHNRLTAHDIRTGKLVWEVGGSKAAELQLAGTFFLGPPLPLDGLLYVLAESRGEIRLLVLNPKDGRPEWSQTLYDVERPVLQDPYRPLAGVSPSYSDGVLVCPTAAGAVVAVDLTSRSLLWGYRYQSTIGAGQNAMMRRIQMQQGGMASQANTERWADSLATIADGRVILTPVDSDEIHCVNLVDGSLAWKKKRNNGLYVGGIYEGKVIVVGRRQIEALALHDTNEAKGGEAAWKTNSTSIPAPTGRGFLSGNLYYVPVVTSDNAGEVVSIDVADNGRVVSRTRSRSEYVPGNLICFRGTVISQGVLQLESFHELSGLEKEIANDLARNPDDPVALGKRGEVLAQRGQIKAAIAHLKRSLELKDDQQTRQLLVDALLEGLRVDFVANRDTAAEIEKLVNQLPEGADATREARARFLRLTAIGLQAAGERDAAFATYMKFVTPDVADTEPERIEGSWQVQRHRWVQGQLNDLYNEANPEQREKMDREILERLTAARNQNDPVALRRFLNYFGSHPVAQRAREELAVILIGKRQWLEAEILLRQLENDTRPEFSNAGVARMANMLVTAKRPGDATVYFRRLSGPLADKVCLDGKTGRQLFEEMADGTVKARMAAGATWPTGRVDAETLNQTQQRHQYQHSVRMLGQAGPFFTEGSLMMDNTQQFLASRDELGAEQWRISLQSGDRRQIFTPVANHARAYGHLLLVARGQSIHAIDTLAGDDRVAPKVMWEQSLTDPFPGAQNQGVNFNRVNVGGRWQVMAMDAYGSPIGPVGPATANYVCFQRRRKLIAVDPMSGKEAWVRTDVNPGSDLFGDEEVLFVVPPDSTEAMVLRALDGKRLDKRNVPPANQRLLSVGRQILCWSDEGGKQTLKLLDPYLQKEIWKREFPLGSKTALVESEEIGVFDQDGNFKLLDIKTGAERIAAKVAPEQNMNEMYLLRSPDRYLLITSRPYQQNNNLFVSPVNGGVDNPIINGHVHLFDRSNGKFITSTEVERQAITLNQPTSLPVLAFACRVYDRQGKRNRDPFELLCLDKRTGRVVYNEKLALQLNGMDLEGEPANNLVKVKLIQGGINLKFTNEPIPEPKPAEKPADKPADGKPAAPGNAAGGANKVGQAIPVPGRILLPANAIPLPVAAPAIEIEVAAPVIVEKKAEKKPEEKKATEKKAEDKKVEEKKADEKRDPNE